jgi:hypothetical protein
MDVFATMKDSAGGPWLSGTALGHWMRWSHKSIDEIWPRLSF